MLSIIFIYTFYKPLVRPVVGDFEGLDVVGFELNVVVRRSVGNTISDLEGSLVVGLAEVVHPGEFV